MRTRVLGAAIAAATLTLIGSSMGTPAHATTPKSGPAVLTIVYDASGATTLARSGFDVPLGPSELTAGLAQDGTFRADLPLPRQHVSFAGRTVTPSPRT